MKRLNLLILIILLFLGCKKPAIIMNGDKIYSIELWEAGTFLYVEYTLEGFNFDDAIILEKEFSKWGDEKGIRIQSIGRFPNKKNWQLGFITKEIPEEKTFKDKKIFNMKIPTGKYAKLKTKGYPERIFKHWSPLKKRLIEDNYAIMSPVIEIYTDFLDSTITPPHQLGEIRYRILDKLEKPKILQ